ncbi:MAG: O-antigen ligase family protein [Candidatus Hydrogenedentota bacterium]
MSRSETQSQSGHSFFQKGILTLLLISLFAIPLCVTTWIDEGEDKWFLVRTIGPLLVVLLVVYQSGKKINAQPIDALAVFALAWIAVQVLSIFGAVNIGVSLAGITRQIGLVSFFFLVRFFAANHSALLKIACALLLVGLATSIYGIIQHFGYDFIHWQQHHEVPLERGVSFMGHATFAASVIIMLIPLAIALAIHLKARIAKIGLVVTALIMLYHLSFTGARVATVALFLSAGAGTVAYLFAARFGTDSAESQSRTKSLPAKTTILVLLAIAVAGSISVQRAWSLKGSDVLGLLEGGLAQRIYAWETANRMFLAHPVNGVGIGNYEVVSPAFWNTVEASRYAQLKRSLYQPHNEYIEAAAETGIAGVAVLLGIVVFALIQSITRTRLPLVLSAGLFAAILASAMDAFFLFPWQVPESGLIFWALLGIVSGQSILQPAQLPAPPQMEPETV